MPRNEAHSPQSHVISNVILTLWFFPPHSTNLRNKECKFHYNQPPIPHNTPTPIGVLAFFSFFWVSERSSWNTIWWIVDFTKSDMTPLIPFRHLLVPSFRNILFLVSTFSLGGLPPTGGGNSALQPPSSLSYSSSTLLLVFPFSYFSSFCTKLFLTTPSPLAWAFSFEI